MRLLLDENLEHEVYHRLVSFGHDVVHVEVSDELVKGLLDSDIAAASLNESRIIVTYDDDFRTNFSTADYHAVLLVGDQELSARKIADIVHEVSRYYNTDDLSGVTTVGRSWLDWTRRRGHVSTLPRTRRAAHCRRRTGVTGTFYRSALRWWHGRPLAPVQAR